MYYKQYSIYYRQYFIAYSIDKKGGVYYDKGNSRHNIVENSLLEHLNKEKWEEL